MTIANTTILLKKSGVPGNVPSSLTYGELGINYHDGKLFYLNSNNIVSQFITGSNVANTNSFSTINVNSSLILATSPTDILSIVPGNNITISTNTTTKTITIDSTSGGSDQYARDTANSGIILAQAAFNSGNTTLTYAQAAFALANTDASNITTLQGVNTTQNTNITNATTLAQASYNASNGVSSYANTTFATSVYATAGYGQANTATTLAQASYNASNGVSSYANTTFATSVYATAAYGQANTGTTLAQAAYNSGNNTNIYATAGYGQANTATTLAQASYNASNGVSSYANTTFFTKSGGTISGDTTINGNVTVTGATFYANVVNLRVEDNIITVNSNVTGAPTQDGGIEVNRGTSANTYLLWKESDKAWKFTNDGTNYDEITGLNYANAAYDLANSTTTYAQAAFALANTNASDITIIQGVDATQNTNITSVTNISAAAFNKANNSVQTVSGTSGHITSSGTTAITLDLATTGVTAGTYTYPSIQIDAYGRTTTISSQTPVTSFNGMTGAVTLSSANVVSALTYTPSNKAGDNFTGNVIVPTLTANTSVGIGSGFITTATLTTSATTANQVADLFATTIYRSAEYLVQMTSGTSYHTIKLLVIHDGTTVWMSQYGEIFTGSSLGTFDANISGGNVQLLFTPTNAITTVKLIRSNIVV